MRRVMLVELFGTYLESLVQFWTQALTIRIPHFVIMLLIAWLLFGKGHRRRRWRWCCGCSGRCACTCGRCCCGADADGGDDGDTD
ncbi:MAG: hypothetical protein HKO53_00960 [Gemmatimonadetes bacterium]|nr:hypothetical protein [Gemmatimonadota bacterium]NNM31601.1 hypothetical protein [Gemmatimonadota bacterium]